MWGVWEHFRTSLILYMGTQNGSKLEVWRWGLLIHASGLKLWHFEIFSHVCMRKPYVCNVFRPRATWVGVAMHHVWGVLSVLELLMGFCKKCTVFSGAKLTNDTNRRLCWAFTWKSYSRRGRQTLLDNQKHSLWSAIHLLVKVFLGEPFLRVLRNFSQQLLGKSLILFLHEQLHWS